MKKNEVFTFTAPNGVEVTAVVIDIVANEISILTRTIRYLCYSQNRLFTYEEKYKITNGKLQFIKTEYGKILVDYVVLPEYDMILEEEQQKFNDDCYEALSSTGDMDF